MTPSKTYSTMKDSGTEWLRKIPEDWRITKIGSIYELRNERVSDKEYPPLSVTMKGIVPQLASAAKTDDGDNRKLVCVGDFAINSRSDRRGSCGISAYDGSVSLINTVLTPKEKMNPNYYDWLFHTSYFADEFYKWGHGIVADLWTTRWQEMKKIIVPVPNSELQQQIADYLDEQCGQIDSVIEETKASIEEYKTWKASIIYETVTKGLDPTVEMKDSGVQWIGEMPAKWKKTRIKYCADFAPSCDTSQFCDESIVTFAPMECIKNGYYINRDEVFGKINSSYTPFQEGDIVIAKVTPCFENGNIAIMNGLHNKFGFGSSELFVFRAKTVLSKYLFYCLQNQKLKQHACATMTGTGGLKRVSPAFLQNSHICLPNEDEQQAIADHLDRLCSGIEVLMAEKQALVTDLESYKKSLIYETVTGKRKVV